MKIYQLAFLVLLLGSCGRKYQETKPVVKDLSEMVFASGTLQADGQYSLQAQSEGSLSAVNFKEGDLVQTGQVMARVENNPNTSTARGSAELLKIARKNTAVSAPAMQQILATIESAKAQLALNTQQEQRYKRLLQSNSVSSLEYQNTQLAVTTTAANLRALMEQFKNQQIASRQQEVSDRITSEVSSVAGQQNLIRIITPGKVYQKLKFPGDYVKKGDVIAVIGNPSLIYALLSVDETSMSKLKIGQPVLVRLNTSKKRIYKAILKEIEPAFDVASQSFMLKAWFTDSLDFRITGTQLEANILVGEKKDALVIPRNFLDYGNTVILKNGRQSRVVTTGIVSNDWVEILSGLKKEDELISYN